MIENLRPFQTVKTSYPHIARQLELFWGYPEFVSIAHDLQHNSGHGSKAGFPADVLFAVSNLASAHDRMYPHLAKKISPIWNLRTA